uniref:Uncharacterized protein n=1 Tax=viral metagenome TaxID=1070528 RepID=A0A6M3J375_9ZZZZ
MEWMPENPYTEDRRFNAQREAYLEGCRDTAKKLAEYLNKHNVSSGDDLIICADVWQQLKKEVGL